MTDSVVGKAYEIKIRGKLRESWADTMGGLELSYDRGGHTILTGRLVDQVALRGILCRIWDLNLEVISVVQLSEEADHA